MSKDRGSALAARELAGSVNAHVGRWADFENCPREESDTLAGPHAVTWISLLCAGDFESLEFCSRIEFFGDMYVVVLGCMGIVEE